MTAIETGCPYTIVCNGITSTFNVPSDPNFCGYIDDVTGLDMYGVRENAQVLSSADGGYHGNFWRDRRPFTLSGFVMPVTPVIARDAAQEKMQSAVGNALRLDAQLTWTPADGIQKGFWFRLQQPVRITKGQSNVQKRFLIAGVCRDWRVLKWAGSQASASGATLPVTVPCTNNGNADAAPLFTITGPIVNPIITSASSGKKFTLNATVTAGNTVTIDLRQAYPLINSGGADWSQYVDPLNSDYTIAVPSGTSNFYLTSQSGSPGTTAATALQVNWNDSWH